MPESVKECPKLSLVVRMTLGRDGYSAYPLLKVRKEHIETYVKTINVLLSFYQAYSNIAKAASESRLL